MTDISRKDLYKGRPEKLLTRSLPQKAGRNRQGRITVRHRGGGVKRLYRIIDFRRNKYDISAKVETIEYDPNRGALIAKLLYKDGERRYIIAPQGIKRGNEVVSSAGKLPLNVGNRMKLKYLPVGTSVHDLEIYPGAGGKLIRAAGGQAQVAAYEGKYTTLKMPSGEVRKILSESAATIGQVSNAERRNIVWGKAGRRRKLGRRPHVRGAAMNPVDHPHGGGEGRAPIGLKHPKTPWGKIARGVKTRKRKKHSNKLIIKRRK